MGKWKSLRFDPFRHVNFKTVSAGFFGTLVASWVVFGHLFTIGLFFIGLLLLLGGEWYAREITRKPMDETYWSVFWGCLITGVGISLVHIWTIFCIVSIWFHPFIWIWCFGLTGGPMIAWQRRKRNEQVNRNNIANALLGSKLSKDNKS